MNTLPAAYARLCADPDFIRDPDQVRAVDHLQRVYDAVTSIDAGDSPWRSAVQGIARLIRRRRPVPVKGLYLWGGVGRGKTMLVDTFYAALPTERKRRVHFHAFMRRVHGELKTLRDRTEPLRLVAGRLREEVLVLCLDEFHVGDIADAMILGNLLEALFEQGLVLVATSNEAPDRLYAGGLQRQRFLPTIDLLQRHMEVLQLSGTTDYRLRTLKRMPTYLAPIEAETDLQLRRSFDELAPEAGSDAVVIDVEGRPIRAVREADGVVWFRFEDVCGGPRAAADYIEIARCYQTVLVSEIPVMDELRNDAARRFIHMIDEFYDRRVKLVCSAAAAPAGLYTGRRLAALFQRSVSRLEEMQSEAYLLQAHSTD